MSLAGLLVEGSLPGRKGETMVDGGVPLDPGVGADLGEVGSKPVDHLLGRVLVELRAREVQLASDVGGQGLRGALAVESDAVDGCGRPDPDRSTARRAGVDEGFRPG